MMFNNGFGGRASRPLLAAALLGAMAVMPAWAFELDTGNKDLAIRWDSTVKLNLARRMQGQNADITRSANFNDGDLNFAKGEMASQRIDLFSRLELAYRQQTGFLLSGAAWYDAAYDGLDHRNPTPNHLVNGKPAVGLSDYTDRYAHGPSGELLEAYAFRHDDFGAGRQLDLTAGKSLQSWGNSALYPLHGINYGQFPLEIGKILTIPLNEREEVFLPRQQLTADYKASPEWAFGAEYFLDWQHSRFPEAGSYMGMLDLALDGGEALYLPNGKLARHGSDVTPNTAGDFGLNARWSPAWLGGTLGLFYRRTADTMPDTVVLNPQTNKYAVAYAGGIDLYGVSLSKTVGGVKLGADLSLRHNTPLVSQPILTVLPAKVGTPGFIGAMPQDGDTGGARGNTLHAVLNGAAGFGRSAVFDRASLLAELSWNRLLSVSEGYAQYRGNPAYTGIDKATRDFYGLALRFTPAWNQVYSDVDLSMPLGYMVGLKGESAVPLGGNAHTGNYSVGLSAMVHAKYQIDLKYSAFFGPYVVGANGQITSYAGLLSLLDDRGTLSLTFKTRF
jgi:hypothetical protein